MFATPYDPLAALPMMDAATAMRMTPGSPLNPGPAGSTNGGPSTIHVTDPSRYGMRPTLYGGGMSAALRPSPVAAPTGAPAPARGGGMFAGGGKHGLDWHNALNALLMGIAGYQAARGVPGAAENLQNIQEVMRYRMKKADADKQNAEYVQALVANGMDPNQAVIMAADPAEMAKHIGTRFDAATVDEGSSRYVPNLNGTASVFTSPKTFQHGADVVQMPGSQTVTPDLGSAPLGAPQALGSPTTVPGLRTDAEQYAASTGAQPGTPEYLSAVQDYGLKANGPTAFGFSQQLQDARLANARDIASGHDAASRYRADHPAPRHPATTQPRPPTPSTVIGAIMDKQAAGQPLTAPEQATLKEYRTHYKPQRGGVQITPNEPIAHGPNGERLVVRNGVWVNSATGQPVR